MTWHILVNPRAGRHAVPTAALEKATSDAGIPAIVTQVDGVDAMRKTAVDRVRGGGRIAIVGGDGTVSQVVDALLETGAADPENPLGIIPVGTGCDLLRTFGHRSGRSAESLSGATRRLVDGTPYLIDVGYLDGSWGRRHFVNVAQAGVGAAAAETAIRFPRRLGPARYPMAFAARLPGFPRTDVTIQGGRWSDEPMKALAVIIANGQFFAGGWNIAPKAILMDGALDVQVIDAPKTAAPALVPKLMRGLHLREPGVRRRPTTAFHLTTSIPWPVEADGDLIGFTPLEVGVLPGAVSILI